MRILLVSEDLPTPAMGGLARHVLLLARALQADGHQVDLMGNDDIGLDAAGSDFDFNGGFFGDLHGQFDGWKEMSLGVFMPLKRSALAQRFARAILRRAAAYDAIHYHGHLPNIASYIPASFNFIQTRHDQGSDCLVHTRFKRGAICKDLAPTACADCRSWTPNPLQRQVTAIAVSRFRNEVRQGFERHKTVFVSDFLQHNLSRCFGRRRWGVTINNFIDTEALDRMPPPWLPACPTGSLAPPLRIFIAAKLYPAKGVECFLDTLHARAAVGTWQKLQIEVAGDGNDEAKLRLRFPDVYFHGWQDAADTLRLAAHAHALVVPSVCEEACASTVLEGLGLGKVVFALRLGGTPELTTYAQGLDQLRLHDTMMALVDALLAFRPRPDYPITPARRAAPALAAGRLLALYRMPAGAIGLQ
jgi:glycosyltransferase involved in cell wall biosynthesis